MISCRLILCIHKLKSKSTSRDDEARGLGGGGGGRVDGLEGGWKENCLRLPRHRKLVAYRVHLHQDAPSKRGEPLIEGRELILSVCDCLWKVRRQVLAHYWSQIKCGEQRAFIYGLFSLMAFYGSQAKKKKKEKRKSGPVLSVLVGRGEFTVYLTDQIDTQGAKKSKNMWEKRQNAIRGREWNGFFNLCLYDLLFAHI